MSKHTKNINLLPHFTPLTSSPNFHVLSLCKFLIHFFVSPLSLLSASFSSLFPFFLLISHSTVHRSTCLIASCNQTPHTYTHADTGCVLCLSQIYHSSHHLDKHIKYNESSCFSFITDRLSAGCNYRMINGVWWYCQRISTTGSIKLGTEQQRGC